jgi:microcystin-dependent protein
VQRLEVSSVSGRARSAWLGLFLLTGAASGGCGFHSDIAALGRLRGNIQAQIGTDSAITVHTSEGATTVTVRLAHLPPGDSKQVQAEVEALAKAEFPKTNYVVVGRL